MPSQENHPDAFTTSSGSSLLGETIKWGMFLVSSVLFLASGTALRQNRGYIYDNGVFTVILLDGIVHSGRGGFDSGLGTVRSAGVERNSYWRVLWNWFGLPSVMPGQVILPLGLPSLLCGVLTVWLFGRNRPHPVGHCKYCGYDLRTNVSGRCPECGTPTEPGDCLPNRSAGLTTERKDKAIQ